MSIAPIPLATMANREWGQGQLSDGWGEEFEQREIATDSGDLYIEPWAPSDDFRIYTQPEFDAYMGISEHGRKEEYAIYDKENALRDRLEKNLSTYDEIYFI